MPTTDTTSRRRLALLPVDQRTDAGRPVIRRYRLGRVLDDLGAYVAAPRAKQAPVAGVRAP